MCARAVKQEKDNLPQNWSNQNRLLYCERSKRGCFIIHDHNNRSRRVGLILSRHNLLRSLHFACLFSFAREFATLCVNTLYIRRASSSKYTRLAQRFTITSISNQRLCDKCCTWADPFLQLTLLCGFWKTYKCTNRNAHKFIFLSPYWLLYTHIL